MGSDNPKLYEFLSVARWLAAAALLLAVFHLPYSYYIFLRWFVSITALSHIGLALYMRRYSSLGSFIPILFFFNPIDPVFLSKGIWIFIDILAAILWTLNYEDFTRGTKQTPSA